MTSIQPGFMRFPTPATQAPAPASAVSAAPGATSWEGDQAPVSVSAQSGGLFHGLLSGIENFFHNLFHHQAPSAIAPTAPIGGSASSPQEQLIAEAMRFKDIPYLWGGGHTSGTFSQPGPVDCSGLITQAARMAGISGLEGTAAGLQGQGRSISLSNVQRGDLVYMGNPAHHVGIYLGNNQVLEAPHTGDVVKICALNGYGWTSANRPNAYGNAAPAPAPTPASAPKPSPTQASSPTPKPTTPPAAPASPGGSCTVQAGDTL
jgi:cell wall-associated NlpC family hydrolase